MILTTDDLCLTNLKYFEYWDKVKEKRPELKIIAFTTANYQLKEDLSKSKEFKDWFKKHEDWVEIAVHGYDHLSPPEVERDNLEELITKSLNILKEFLPEKYGYRSPGFKFSVTLEPILKKLGFSYIAYHEHIKVFKNNSLIPVLNTHCCDRYDNPITEVWKRL